MQKLRFFIFVLIFSLPFWAGVNLFAQNIENIFLGQALSKNQILVQRPTIFQASIADMLDKTRCELDSITARSFISARGGKTIFSKNENEKMPIASLTKLLSGLVTLEFYRENEKIMVSQEAVDQPEITGEIKTGEILSAKELLGIALIESSNDAALALTQPSTEQGFVGLMNLKAGEIGMKNSAFFNPTGLDPEDIGRSSFQINVSTAFDLAVLVEYILANKPEIIDVISQKELPLYLENGSFHHTLKNTNELLGQNSLIVGGKTGSTERAGECLLLILKSENPGEYIINVVLGSRNRFRDMEILNSCSFREFNRKSE